MDLEMKYILYPPLPLGGSIRVALKENQEGRIRAVSWSTPDMPLNRYSIPEFVVYYVNVHQGICLVYLSFMRLFATQGGRGSSEMEKNRANENSETFSRVAFVSPLLAALPKCFLRSESDSDFLRFPSTSM